MDQMFTHLKKDKPTSKVRKWTFFIEPITPLIISCRIKKRFSKIAIFVFQIIFIFVSDDIYWVKQNIYTRVKRGFNAFLVQTGKSDEFQSIGTFIDFKYKLKWSFIRKRISHITITNVCISQAQILPYWHLATIRYSLMELIHFGLGFSRMV